jgi:hypothetical protein
MNPSDRPQPLTLSLGRQLEGQSEASKGRPPLCPRRRAACLRCSSWLAPRPPVRHPCRPPLSLLSTASLPTAISTLRSSESPPSTPVLDLSAFPPSRRRRRFLIRLLASARACRRAPSSRARAAADDANPAAAALDNVLDLDQRQPNTITDRHLDDAPASSSSLVPPPIDPHLRLAPGQVVLRRARERVGLAQPPEPVPPRRRRRRPPDEPRHVQPSRQQLARQRRPRSRGQRR